jgi:AraC-like DNA-binding protein
MEQPALIGEESEHVNRLRYRELVPPHHLREVVACFWHRPVGPVGAVARVVPDGCIDMIWVDDRPPVIAGPATLPMIHPLVAGTDILGIRFRPGTAHRLLGIPAVQLLNQEVPLRDIWPNGRCLAWEEPAHQETLPDKLRAIHAAVRSQVAATDDDLFVSRAAAWLAHHPMRPVEELGHQFGLSPRQIHRRFAEAVGYGPKKLQRIMRLQRLLWLVDQRREPHPDLARLSFEAGYADQPHMTREVTILTGVPPSQLFRGTTVSCAVSDLFKTPMP